MVINGRKVIGEIFGYSGAVILGPLDAGGESGRVLGFTGFLQVKSVVADLVILSDLLLAKIFYQLIVVRMYHNNHNGANFLGLQLGFFWVENPDFVSKGSSLKSVTVVS